ncbi:MAG: phosphatase PAP2 family protein [Pseudomonadota bacterium]
MRVVWVAAIALLIGAAPGDDARGLLTAADLDPVLVLPPPPATDSPQGRAELVELRTMLATGTPAERDAAAALGKTKDVSLFAGAVRGLDLTKLPATARLFELVRATEKDVVDRGKDEFKRPRPWIVDPAIVPCSRGDDPLSSYPSGHATMAYSMAGVLVRLIPARAPAILARAAEFAQTRLTCDQHFRSDVTAGEALGLLLAERLMAKPAFAKAFAEARDELGKAGVR